MRNEAAEIVLYIFVKATHEAAESILHIFAKATC
jgi:hypothetical protein